jgi:hypothetical protein
MASVWILAYADDLAVVCASSVRLSRALKVISEQLAKFSLRINLLKTEVVTFLTATRPVRQRPPLPVKIGRDTVPNVPSFKYLGVSICAKGTLHIHQRAVAGKAMAAASEVSRLFSRLQIRDLGRLSSYLQMYVDGQFYGAELLPLHTANQMDAARKLFVCTTFQLPKSTARNLIYVLFPVMPALFLLLRRRWSFYARARTHDVDAVRDAFLFDEVRLFPHSSSWSFQTAQMLRELGLSVDVRRREHVQYLERVFEDTEDVEQVCFDHVSTSTEKTLSYFRLFQNVDDARSFRLFLSTQTEGSQNFFVLFLTSGLRWRFFKQSSRGTACPCCREPFWSWSHFLSCVAIVGPSRVPHLRRLTARQAWADVFQLVISTTRDWKHYFSQDSLSDLIRDL